MVTEIQPKAGPKAATMNTLIQGCESLLRRLFAGKSPLILDGITGTAVTPGHQHPYGRFFYFKSGLAFRYLGNVENYVQHIYQNKVDSWDTGFIDTEAGNVALVPALSDLVTDFHGDNQNVLHQSLKPMTREYAGVEYQVVADVAGWPSHEKFERVRWYEVAEIVFEGHAEFTWDDSWTKYRFLRFHNLSEFPMVLNFDIHTYSIPAFGVKTIRWNLDGIVSTGNYLWPMMAGDPRLHMVNDNRMTANPVCNPLILLRWIEVNIVRDGTTRPGFHVDGRLLPAVAGYENLFGNPAFDTTLLGDLIHHKGTLAVMRKPAGGEWSITEIQFNGYLGLVADLALVGITAVETDGVFTLEPTEEGESIDIFAIGTNLLDKEGETVWAVELPYTLEGQWVARWFDAQDDSDVFGTHESQQQLIAWGDELGNPETFKNDYEGTWGLDEFGTDQQEISYQIETVNYSGEKGAPIIFNPMQTRQDLVGVIESKGLKVLEIKLTPHGFAVMVERERGDLSGTFGLSGIFGFPFLIAGNAASANPTDWNTTQIPPTNDSETLNRIGVLFIGSKAWNPTTWGPVWQTVYPRVSLKTSATLDQEFTEDGTQTALWVGMQPGVRTEVQRLARLDVDPGSTNSPWRVFHGIESTVLDFLSNRFNPDWYEANRERIIANDGQKTTWARPALAVEDFNVIAGWINAVESVTPITVLDVYWELSYGLSETVQGIPRTLGETVFFPPTYSDLFSLFMHSRDAGTIVPKKYFRTVNEADLFWPILGPFLLASGIPIRTEADLPSSFHSIQTETTNFRYWNLIAMETDNSFWVEGTPPEWWDVETLGPYYVPGSNDRSYYGEFELNSISGLSDIPNEYRFNTGGGFKWLHVDDIKAFADSKGLPFFHYRLGIPVRIAIYTPPDPVWEVARTPAFTGLNIDEIRPREAPGTGVDVGPHAVAGGTFSTTNKHAYLERVYSEDDTEFLLIPPGGAWANVRNITSGLNQVEAGIIWCNLGALRVSGHSNLVLGWVRPVYSEGFLDWIYGRKQALAVETVLTNDLTATLKSRLYPAPFPWIEPGADTFENAHPTPDQNPGGASLDRFYPINYARRGPAIPTTTTHESDFAIIKTDEFGVYHPLIYWRATAA